MGGALEHRNPQLRRSGRRMIALWIGCGLVIAYVFAHASITEAAQTQRRLEQRIADVIADTDVRLWEKQLAGDDQ